MAAEVLAKKQKIGLLQQSKVTNHWAAPADASANYLTLNYNSGVSIPDPDVQVDNFNWTSASTVMKEYTRRYVDSLSGLPKINFTSAATKAVLAPHLTAFFQNVSEGATTPFTKSFDIASSVLDFATNEGYLHTIAMYNYDGGESADGAILENALLDTFTFEIMPNNRGVARLANISGTWVGNEMNLEQNLTGTWVAMPTTGFYNTSSDVFSLSTLTVGATNLASTPYRRFLFSGNNNVSSDVKTTGGKANNYKISPVVTVEVDLPYDSTTYKLLKHYQSGDNVEIAFQNGVGTADGHIRFYNEHAVLTGNPFVYEGDYQAIRLPIEFYAPATLNSPMCKMSDAIDWAY